MINYKYDWCYIRSTWRYFENRLRKAYTTEKIRCYALKNVFTPEELLKNITVFFTSIFTGAAAVLRRKDGGKTSEYYLL